MIIFKTKRTYLKSDLLNLSLQFTGGIVSIGIINWITKGRFFIETSWLIFIILLTIIHYIKERNTDKIREIHFDDGNRQIIFVYKHFFSSLKETSLSYDESKIYIDDDSSVFRWFRKSVTIYFSKGKLDLFDISRRKDGFSHNTMDQIVSTIERIFEEDKKKVAA